MASISKWDVTVTVDLNPDEWYPIYRMSEPGEYTFARHRATLPVDLVKRYQDAVDALTKAQDEVDDLLRKLEEG